MKHFEMRMDTEDERFSCAVVLRLRVPDAVHKATKDIALWIFHDDESRRAIWDAAIEGRNVEAMLCGVIDRGPWSSQRISSRKLGH